MTAYNAFYAQSGGVTPVINASAAGVIQAASQHPDKINKVYAGEDGILGALFEELIDTSMESEADIEALKMTPSGAFGSCRYKLKSIEEQRAEYERLIDVFKAHDIRYFFYNGGGDSQDTAHKVSQLSDSMGYPITCVGVPKTIDNDLPFTDCSPGFGSVAKYVAISILEASMDVASMSSTSTKVFVMEVMGRHAGWIAAAAGLAADERGLGPDIILFPEVPFDEAAFLAKVAETVKNKGQCSIVVSEGAAYPDGRFLADSGVRDAFGHAQLGGVAPVVTGLIKASLGFKCHWAVCDYLQRAARHIGSKTDVEHAYALGHEAVELAVSGHNAVMPTIVRTSDEPYEWKLGKAPLAEVANVEEKMPTDYISEDGFFITEACRRYLAPLIQGEDYPSYRNGLPEYVVLKKYKVAKKLPAFTLTE
ncbi:6-phosphofructokinase [Arenicella xantha]|uniref:Pyrophosphate--fructose 6-phosphate 1-phosphotransferase n=1 Tax=Arenicella xantha TaxID=644221 RepID=A0A395JJW2_9GAMM|nr:6-phosphofructokinase [Arenicella xantha]RBP49088.1 pyrophosphate-dependent phosphofructokinase [Arenicella xantha]